ncbi:MAG: hypothetical protein IKK53_02850 [Ruminiclostridium sp.]|nr:hypothetical protein [Ruminiclostridium sp.]
MTELEKAIMSDDETKDIHTEKDMIPDDDAYEEAEENNEAADEEITEKTVASATEISYTEIEINADDEEDITVKELKKSTVEVERLKNEIKQENEQLDIKFAEVRNSRNQRPVTKRKYFYIGTFSAAASLIFMGIAMTFSLFSPVGILGAFKLAPVMLVFLGIEILLAVIANRSARLKYNIKSLIVTVLLVGITCIMSVISVTNSVTGGERYYAAQRIENMLSREISEAVPSDIIRNVAIELQLHGSDPYAYENISDLESGDIINLEITYIDAQVSMYEFASNCRSVMDGIRTMPYNFGTINFIADDEINSYRMEINWLYQSDFTATELMPLVNYFGNDIVIDIPDLSDDE